MASLRNLNKARQRQHKERGQPEARAEYGLLEKKKDYKQRANDFHRKQSIVTALKRKAQNRNPDEFYFKMVKTQRVDGEHKLKKSTEPAYTDDQIGLMRSQDIKYVNHKRSVELKKIERLKSELHLIDGEDKPRNKHTIFVDTKKEAKEFDAAKHFDTHPSLVHRAYNRPTMETLRKANLSEGLEDETINRFASHRLQRYKELTKRIRRAKELGLIAQKMQTAKHLLDKTSQKKRMSKETPEAAAQYKWEFKRKR